MSGGSFNDLCHMQSDDALSKLEDLHDMAHFLTENNAHAAARETERVIAFIQHFQRQIDVRIERLSPVWKAAEWWQSHDSSEESFREALKLYDGIND